MSKASRKITNEEKKIKTVEETTKNETVEETVDKKTEETAEEEDENAELDPQVFAAFKKKRLIFQLLMTVSFIWLLGMGFVVMKLNSVILGLIVGVVFVGALVGTIIFGFSSDAVFCPHCHKLLGKEIRYCSNCEKALR